MKAISTFSKLLFYILLATSICEAQASEESQTLHSPIGSENKLAQRVGSDRKRFVQFLETTKKDAESFEVASLQTAFADYNQSCSDKMNELGQMRSILDREVERIKTSDLPAQDKKELLGKLEESIAKIERLTPGLKSSIAYCSIEIPKKWGKIHSSWLSISGIEKAKERICTEIDAFIKDLPDVSGKENHESKYKDFKTLAEWGVGALGLVVIVLVTLQAGIKSKHRSQNPAPPKSSANNAMPPISSEEQEPSKKIKFSCPNCDQHFTATLDFIGSEICCPTCNQNIHIGKRA